MTKPEKKPRLPKEVEIREGEKEAVVWKLSSEQYEEEGRFLAEGYSEDARIKAEAEVIVSESEPEAETVYLTAESEESPELPKAVLVTIGNVIEEFDLTKLPETWDSLNLALQARSYNKDFSRAEIYQIENDWDASTITYKDFPKRISDEPAAYLSREELESGGVAMVDVSDVVKEALEKGMTELSLEITIEKNANDNYLGIYSTRAREGITKPSLVWSSIEKPEKADKENLQFVLELAESLNLSDYSNGDLSRLQEAITFGQEIFNTENASTEQIHKAEKELTKELAKLRLKQE